MQKLKQLDRKHIPANLNIFMPFIAWTMVDYWGLPQWLAVVYATLWFILFILHVIIQMNTEKVSL